MGIHLPSSVPSREMCRPMRCARTSPWRNNDTQFPWFKARARCPRADHRSKPSSRAEAVPALVALHPAPTPPRPLSHTTLSCQWPKPTMARIGGRVDRRRTVCGRFTQKLTWREVHDLYRPAARRPAGQHAPALERRAHPGLRRLPRLAGTAPGASPACVGALSRFGPRT